MDPDSQLLTVQKETKELIKENKLSEALDKLSNL